MAIKVEARAGGAAALVNGAQDQILLAADGEVLLPAQKDLEQSAPQAIVTKEMLERASAMPRFSTSLWTGKADAMPEGYVQSSGQQVLDLMYPGLRADVVVSQLACSEVEWQADPYKRVTHWSLGDGNSWMRTPDKNGVQAGNVGGFYGAGSNPARGIFGTAVGDAGRNLTGSLYFSNTMHATAIGLSTNMSGAFAEFARNNNVESILVGGKIGEDTPYGISIDASLQWPVADEFRPRTFYGVWIICIYGKITNKGELSVSGMNARAELLDARISTLEADQKPLGDGQRIKDVTAARLPGVTYTNNTGQTIMVNAVSNRFSDGGGNIGAFVDGSQISFFDTGGANYTTYPIYSVSFAVPNKSTYQVASTTGLRSWMELTSE